MPDYRVTLSEFIRDITKEMKENNWQDKPLAFNTVNDLGLHWLSIYDRDDGVCMDVGTGDEHLESDIAGERLEVGVKALIHDDEDGQVHLLKTAFAKHSLCGKKLHSISTTYTPKLGVTCNECLGVRVEEA